MSQFVRWLQVQWAKSNLISGLLALMIWGTICYLSGVGREITPILATAGGAIIMFFYKAKQES